jgi:hypothetical protein
VPLPNAPDQKRVASFAETVTSAPVFCILMLGCSYLHQDIERLT